MISLLRPAFDKYDREWFRSKLEVPYKGEKFDEEFQCRGPDFKVKKGKWFHFINPVPYYIVYPKLSKYPDCIKREMEDFIEQCVERLNKKIKRRKYNGAFVRDFKIDIAGDYLSGDLMIGVYFRVSVGRVEEK